MSDTDGFMIQPEGEPGHGHRHGARDVDLHIGHTIRGGTQESWTFGISYYTCPEVVPQTAAYDGLVTDLFWISAGGDNLWQWQQ